MNKIAYNSDTKIDYIRCSSGCQYMLVALEQLRHDLELKGYRYTNIIADYDKQRIALAYGELNGGNSYYIILVDILEADEDDFYIDSNNSDEYHFYARLYAIKYPIHNEAILYDSLNDLLAEHDISMPYSSDISDYLVALRDIFDVAIKNLIRNKA